MTTFFSLSLLVLLMTILLLDEDMVLLSLFFTLEQPDIVNDNANKDIMLITFILIFMTYPPMIYKLLFFSQLIFLSVGISPYTNPHIF